MAVTIPKYSEDNCQPNLERLDIKHPFSSQTDLPIRDQINSCNYKITHTDRVGKRHQKQAWSLLVLGFSSAPEQRKTASWT